MIHLMYTTCSVCVDLTMYADIRCLAYYICQPATTELNEL